MANAYFFINVASRFIKPGLYVRFDYDRLAPGCMSPPYGYMLYSSKVLIEDNGNWEVIKDRYTGITTKIKMDPKEATWLRLSAITVA